MPRRGGMDGWRCRDVGVMVMEICGVCFFCYGMVLREHEVF